MSFDVVWNFEFLQQLEHLKYTGSKISHHIINPQQTQFLIRNAFNLIGPDSSLMVLMRITKISASYDPTRIHVNHKGTWRWQWVVSSPILAKPSQIGLRPSVPYRLIHNFTHDSFLGFLNQTRTVKALVRLGSTPLLKFLKIKTKSVMAF